MKTLLAGWREDSPIREAAWVARCVGDPETAPLTEDDLTALASYLEVKEIDRGTPTFAKGDKPRGVWIVRSGMIELYVGAGPRKVVVQILYPGAVDGDIQLLKGMPLPYAGRALQASRCLFLEPKAFESLLRDHPGVARRWLSSVASRLTRSHERLIGLLGRTLIEQIAQLLLDEQHSGRILLPQRTLAAMLGVQRPSLNRVLKDLEARGHIKLGYGRIEIADLDAIERLSKRVG
jgi:CRP/FNR family transcriptional regulator, cAMP and macrophage regulator